MKDNLKKIAAGILAVMLVVSAVPFFAVSAGASDGNIQTVRVGFFGYPGYHDFDGSVRSGYGVDFLTLLRRYSDLNYEYVGYENSWEEMQKMLLDGEIDLVTSARKTPEREKLYDFSEPIGESYAHINVRQDDDRFISGDYSALNGMTIGIIAGNSRNADLEAFAGEKNFTYQTVQFQSAEELEQALKDKEVDAAATSSLRRTTEEKTVAEFAPEAFYVIVRKGDTALLDEINYGINQMDVNEGNWRDDIRYRNYGRSMVDTLEFTQREQEYIKAVQNGEKAITAAVQPDRDPYSFVENGEVKGIIPDYFAHLMETAGLPYTVLVPKDRDEYRTWTMANFTDVIMDCRYSSSPSVQYEFGLVTDPYMEITTSRVTRKGFTGQIHSIAAVDSAETGYFGENIAEDAEYLSAASSEEAMQAVKDGRADVCYVYTYTAEKFINTDPESNLQSTVLKYPVDTEYIYVSPNSDHELCSILNKCLKADAAGALDDYVRKYTAVTYDHMSFRQYFKLNPHIAFIVSAILALLIAVIAVSVVRSRTAKMKAAQLEQEIAKQKQLEEQQRRLNENMQMVGGLADRYETLYYVNIDEGTFKIYALDGEKFPETSNIVTNQTDAFEAIKMFGSSPIVHPDDRHLFDGLSIDTVRERLAHSKKFSIRYRQDDGVGRYVWFEMEVIKYENIDERANAIAVGFANRDAEIRDEQEHERLLQDAYDRVNEANLRNELLYRISNAIKWSYEIGTDDRIVSYSYADEAEKTVLSDGFEDNPMAWADVVHPDDREAAVKAFEDAIRDRTGMTPYDSTYRIMGTDGKYVWLKVAGRMRRREDGTGEMFGMSINITDQMETQQKRLLGAIPISSDILTKANIGMWAFELDEGQPPRMYDDETMLGLVGLDHQVPPEEAYHAWYDHIDGNSYDLVNDAVNKMISGEHAEVQYPWHYPDGRTIIVRCGGVRNFEYTKGIRIEGTHQDVTQTLHFDEEQRKREEQQRQDEIARIKAEASDKAKTEFLFNMSHDIRTPMNAILGYTDIALNHIDESDRVNDSLKKIRTSGGHLLGLINDILEMSRIEAGRMEIIDAPLNIYQVTEGVVNMSRSLAVTKDISFSAEIGDLKNPYIYSDELHTNQVIINLISNAIKYTNPGGTVEYRIEQISEPVNETARYRVIVKDTGIGMSDEFQKHLFESFARENTSTVSRQEGAGLGLAIVKRIVDLMGGTISVSSRQGKGSTFVVELPLRVMDDAAVEAFEAARSRNDEMTADSSLEGRRVLLVEDNEMNREIATEILDEAGLIVDQAEDGAIAVRRVMEKGVGFYDFILMDIQMPVMNGYEATAEIRKLPDGDRVPVIALSANAFKEDVDKSLAAGMNAHVAKPINITELFRTLAGFL